MPRTSLYVLYHFQDNRGKRAELRFWLPISLAGSGGADALAASIATALLPLSDARLTHYEVVHHESDLATPEATPTSNSFRRVSLLYRDGEGSGSVTIPSFVEVSPDEGDPYNTVRISRGTLLLSGLLDNVEAIVIDTLRPDGSPFPATFAVGGAAGGQEL